MTLLLSRLRGWRYLDEQCNTNGGDNTNQSNLFLLQNERVLRPDLETRWPMIIPYYIDPSLGNFHFNLLLKDTCR